MSHKFSSEYNKLLLGEKELLLAGNYHCSIVNFAGHEMFKKDFKKRIVNISPTGKRQKYLITYEIVQIYQRYTRMEYIWEKLS